MADDPTSRLVLGTAQLGMAYGIANRAGLPDRAGAYGILAAAWSRGIRVLDTAQAYGDSEVVIGGFLTERPECDFEVISKLEPGIDRGDPGAIAAAVHASRHRIGRPLEAMLLHDAAGLDDWDGPLGGTLRDCVARGTVRALGVSVYTPDQLARALDIDDIGIIQAPFNALDRRLADCGLLAQARAAGKRIFLRSAYLQGLLVMSPDALPPHMAFAADTLAGWRDLCAAHNLAPEEAALRYVCAAAPQAEIVVGCETVAQLESNLKFFKDGPATEEFSTAVAALPLASERLINPALWPPCPAPSH